MMCAVIALGFTSCEHKDLCYHHPHTAKIKVVYDWTDAPDADPEGMCAFFYPLDGDVTGNQPRRFDFIGSNGGEIELPVGRYRVITYNNDTESTLMRNSHDWDLHSAFTRDGGIFEPVGGDATGRPPRRVNEDDQRIVITPDMLWGCTATDVEITETGISYVCVPEKDNGQWDNKPIQNSEQVITLYPHELVCHYTYEIRNVTGMENVSQMSASLSGMSPELFFGDERLHQESVILPFEAAKAPDGSKRIVGAFLTFGHSEQNTDPHRLNLYVWLNDGSKWVYGATDESKFDLTGQVHSAPDKRHVHLVIDGLDLPQPMTGDSGMDPWVDDWQVVDEEIIM